MQYLEILQNWVSNNQSQLEEKGITVDLVKGPQHEKPSMYVDMNTENSLARVTAWSSGELQMEVIQVGSGKQLIVEARRAENPKEMIDFIVAFVSRIP